MNTTSNQQWRLAARPVGLPKDSDWKLTSEPIPTVPESGLLLRTLMISIDPAMRGWMNDAKSYIKPVGIGEVMRAGAICEVIDSRLAGFNKGEAVYAGTGVQQFLAVPADQIKQVGVSKVDLSIAPPEKWLNALGMPGISGSRSQVRPSSYPALPARWDKPSGRSPS
jgi:NADPH-dependent curcumin reductase